MKVRFFAKVRFRSFPKVRFSLLQRFVFISEESFSFLKRFINNLAEPNLFPFTFIERSSPGSLFSFLKGSFSFSQTFVFVLRESVVVSGGVVFGSEKFAFVFDGVRFRF